ncbi:MAG: multicopper oxidase domain-containing protein, partial [Terriglobales bacterium]
RASVKRVARRTAPAQSQQGLTRWQLHAEQRLARNCDIGYCFASILRSSLTSENEDTTMIRHRSNPGCNPLRSKLCLGWRALLLLCFFPLAGLEAQSKPAALAPASGWSVVRDPSDLPGPVGKQPLADLPPAHVVRVLLTAQEVVAPLDPDNGLFYRYWTFNGKVPGPMIRVREGDTVVVTLRNNADDHMAHSIDLHAVLGQGGGAALMQVPPGQERTFSFVATTPGLFVYHCGTPMIAEHIANGMYGLILVEPPGGLPRVDHEYYVMQGEIYTAAHRKRGEILELDHEKLMEEQPEFYVLNGAVGALTKQFLMTAAVGQTVRIFFGNAGPNATASPHLVGEIFSRYYAFGSLLSPPLRGVQTATVPPGDAAIFDVKTEMPGQFAFMDHAIARMEQGDIALLKVTGPDVARLMYAGPAGLHGPIPRLAITAADTADALFADVSQTPVLAAPAPEMVAAVATTKVTMTDHGFVPAAIEVAAGQGVTWLNTNGSIHTVIDNAALAVSAGDVALPAGAQTFASPFLLSGQSYTHVFTEPGVYHYVCTQHERDGMIGTVIVRSATRAAAASTKSLRH